MGCRGGRAEHLAQQRPTWAIYETDSAWALARGLGSHCIVDVLDVDPYGDPWPTIVAFFASARPFADTMHVVVNDGMRQKARRRGAWSSSTLGPVVRELGNNLFPIYIEVCRRLMVAAVAPARYVVKSFRGYYTGAGNNMTHYWAVLRRPI